MTFLSGIPSRVLGKVERKREGKGVRCRKYLRDRGTKILYSGCRMLHDKAKKGREGVETYLKFFHDF